MAHGEQGKLNVAGNRQLFKDPITVGVDRFRRQAQFVGNALYLLAAGDHQGDLNLALGKQIEG
ncbi:hypothetical protein D3C72_2334060 [compost metagenome]